MATVLMLLVTPILAFINAGNVGAASSYAAPAFQTQWQGGEAVTPNFWGPIANAHDGQNEPYAEAPGGTRLVQYFDKARMELTNPTTGVVTNGLLATELITGQRQLGDNTFENDGPATVPVAGDPDNVGPTYAAFQANAAQLRNPLAATMGASVTLALTPSGQVTTFATGGNFPQANIAGYDSDTHHNVPAAFLNYRMKAGLLTIGLAISEPFWSNVKVAGQPQDVLIQAFERRVLTYTPSNPAAFQVEFGNIGQHYYAWRYVTQPGGGVSPTAVNSTATLAPDATATPVATTSATATATPAATATTAATAMATATVTPTATPTPVTLTSPSISNVTMSKATIAYTTSVLACGTAELRVKGDTSWSTNIDSITCSPLTMSVTATLTSLNPNTIYEVRGAAKNAGGTIGYSTIGSFTTLTAQPSAESYDGNWVNDDLTSGGIARLYTTTANNMISVHGYGQCGGGECDWGVRTGTFTGDPFPLTFIFMNGAPTITLSMSFTDDTRTKLKVIWSDSAAGTHTETFHRRYLFISPIYTGGINPVLIKP